MRASAILDLWRRFLATREHTLTVEALIQKALESLIAGGPMAIVLGTAIVVLWRENKALQQRLFDVFDGIAKSQKENQK
jgi:hypothetical protein